MRQIPGEHLCKVEADSFSNEMENLACLVFSCAGSLFPVCGNVCCKLRFQPRCCRIVLTYCVCVCSPASTRMIPAMRRSFLIESRALWATNQMLVQCPLPLKTMAPLSRLLQQLLHCLLRMQPTDSRPSAIFLITCYSPWAWKI